MIDGLKLTFSGNELRNLLEERIAYHDKCAQRWQWEQSRTEESETEDAPLLPEHMCEHEEEKHMWRADVLRFIRDHIEANEIYRVGAADVEFGELMPPKPASVEQVEYEERTPYRFHLEQLTKCVGELASTRVRCGRDEQLESPDGYRASRVDVENGPEIIRIDRTP